MTMEEWAERIRQMLDEAWDDGYVIFAAPNGTDIKLMIGWKINDPGDVDLMILDDISI